MKKKHNPLKRKQSCGTYSVHLRSKTVDKNGQYEDIITKTSCKSWDCEYCRRKKGSFIQQQIHKHFADATIYMLTFTYFQQRPKLDVWNDLGVTWNRLRTYLKKNNPNLKYIRIVEPHKSGYPHIHVLTNSYINVATDLKYLTRQGFGYQMMQKIISVQIGVNYVSKYLTKAVWSDIANTLRKASKTRICTASRGIKVCDDTESSFELINSRINHESVPDYVRYILETGIEEGRTPLTHYSDESVVRIVWLCEQESSSENFLLIIAKEFVSGIWNSYVHPQIPYSEVI
jgi:hypothetical protein